MTQEPLFKRYQQLNPPQLNQIENNLTNLDLSHKLLSKSLPELELKFPPTLISLNLQSNNLNFTHLTFIIHLKSLVHLNISNNPIQLDGLKLLTNLRKLQSLNISNIYLKVKGNKDKSRLDFQAIKLISLTFQRLKSLNLGYNNMGKAAEYELLNNLKQLEELNLCQNQIGEIGQKKLDFSNLKKLKQLNLRSNQLTAQMTHILAKLPQLQNLSLAYNYFQQDSIIPILAHLPNLTSLNLSYNFLSNPAVMQISKQCKKLKHLDLRSCRSTLQGFQQILKQLKQLQYLSVNENQIGFPGNNQVLQRIISLLKSSKLKILQIQNCRLHKQERIKLLKQFLGSGLNISAGY